MIGDATVGLIGDLVDQATSAASTSTSTSSGAELTLLADATACVLGAGPQQSPAGWHQDGTSGVAAALAARVHARDLDDLHWPSAVHPGSVIWPAVLAVGAEARASGADVATAARAGYHAMVGLAMLLGREHATRWHATATSGAVGAALSSSLLLGLDRDQRHRACSHAAAVAGGAGQAVLERSGTTRFHRVAAAVLGIQAARLAAAGVPASGAVLEGPRGLLALLAGNDVDPTSIPAQDPALERTSVRLFPVNGFAQAAVSLAAALGREAGQRPMSVVVEVADVVASATRGDVGGPWWDLRAAVAAACVSQDPFDLAPTLGSAELRDWVEVRTGPVGTTTVTVTTANGERSDRLDAPPGHDVCDPALVPMLDRKWDQLVGPGGAVRARTLAHGWLDRGPRNDEITALLRS